MIPATACSPLKLRRVVTAAPVLDQVSVSAYAGYSTRLLRTAYAGSCIQVKRASDSTTQDVGFSADWLDTSALATFCSGTTGYVSKWYDQSGNGHDLTQSTVANSWRIYASGATEVQNTKPALRSIDAVRWMQTAALTAITSTAVTGAVVATLSSVGATNTPRYVSFSSAGQADSAGTDGVLLLARVGSSTATQVWQLNRNGSRPSVTATAVYATLQRALAVMNDPNYSLTIGAGTTSTGSVGTPWGGLNATRINVGHSGSVTASSTDAYISEAILWTSTLSTTDSGIVGSTQQTAFSVS